MRRVKIKEYKRALKLRAKGRSLNEICEDLNASKSTVSSWISSIALSKAARDRIHKRIKRGSVKGRTIIQQRWKQYRIEHPRPLPNLNRLRIATFFDTWTPEMAYVLGYFAADGCMYHSRNGGFYNGGLYFEFTSTDVELLETVRELMSITNKIELAAAWNGEERKMNRKLRYKLRIVNEEAYNKLLQLGLTPAKSLTLKFPSVPDQELCHFLRGYFDGDGCVHFARYKRLGIPGNHYRYVFAVKFTSGSKDFLAALQKRLVDVTNVGLGSLHPHGQNWELGYSKSDSRQLYKFMYPTPTVPHLARKKRKFEEALAVLGP